VLTFFVRIAGKHYIELPGGGSAPVVLERQEIHLEVLECKGLPQMDVGAGVSKVGTNTSHAVPQRGPASPPSRSPADSLHPLLQEDRAKGIGISADPFVVVTLGNVSKQTDVVRDTLDPLFDFSAIFILADAKDERAEIQRKLSDMTQARRPAAAPPPRQTHPVVSGAAGRPGLLTSIVQDRSRITGWLRSEASHVLVLLAVSGWWAFEQPPPAERRGARGRLFSGSRTGTRGATPTSLVRPHCLSRSRPPSWRSDILRGGQSSTG